MEARSKQRTACFLDLLRICFSNPVNQKKLPFKVGIRGINLRTEQTIIERISYVQAETYRNLSPLKQVFSTTARHCFFSDCTLAVSWKVINVASGPSYRVCWWSSRWTRALIGKATGGLTLTAVLLFVCMPNSWLSVKLYVLQVCFPRRHL